MIEQLRPLVQRMDGKHAAKGVAKKALLISIDRKTFGYRWHEFVSQKID
ncbi:hypothetical protein UMZ34_22350 [Halopseudomonas pachastrellae]|nr:hypothetical protein UMZ34_22350 [Halopseudomonas pachastrellae]